MQVERSLASYSLRWPQARLVAALIGAVGPWPLIGGIIGTNPPAQALTAERIAALPAAQQGPWKDYWAHSERQLRADQAFFAAEMRDHGLRETIMPPAGSSRSMPLDRPETWYAGAEGRRIADIVVSFQTPAGGWSKNMDFSQHVRAPGERFSLDNVSLYPGAADNDTPNDRKWNYVGTFDNDATVTQLRFLARVTAAVGDEAVGKYRASFLRGLDYIFAAQYPNGGWPQVWPLQGGYHDAITFNDGAMVNVLRLVRDVAGGKGDFSFVPAPVRKTAAASLERGVRCILGTQILVDGRRTVWCQQHDPLTLKPCSARNYEMPSQSAAESTQVMAFLMELPDAEPGLVAAVHAAAAWFAKTGIRGISFKRVGSEGRQAVAEPDAGPLWARFYQIGTDRPIFGDRDKSIHDNVNEISKERRNGYAWYRDTPLRTLQLYALWAKAHPSQTASAEK